jgi:hypothetical protein
MSHLYFTKRFPEFEDTDPSLIEMAQAEARCEINREQFGDTFEIALHYLAAHKLNCLEVSQEKTIYQLEYERLKAQAHPINTYGVGL